MVYYMRFPMFILALAIFFGCHTPETPATEADEAPPSTDIWLFDLTENGTSLKTRVTFWEGYDNQPMFNASSDLLLFTSTQDGRANTHLFNIETNLISRLNFTEADKYSPTFIPGTNDSQFSVVHTDSSAFQGLWRYSVDGSTAPAPITEVDAVAYFTWVGTDEVLFWRLGTPNTLQLIDIATADTTVLAEGSVLSLHPIIGERASAYILSQSGEPANIMRIDWDTHESTIMAPGLEGAQYFAISPSGELLMMSDGRLMSYIPGESTAWAERADLGLKGGTRLAVSPDGKLLAVVAEAS